MLAILPCAPARKARPLCEWPSTYPAAVRANPALYTTVRRHGWRRFIYTAYLQWDVPSAPGEPKHHSYREEHTPDRRLKEDMKPQNGIYRSVRLFLREFIVVFVGHRGVGEEQDKAGGRS